MGDRNVALITFHEPGRAYEAISELRRADADGRIEIVAAALVEREPDGRIRVAEGQDEVIGKASVGGGLLGILIGVLGGSLGLLLGWGAGSLLGGYFDVRRAERTETALAQFSRLLPPGGTAVLAQLVEVDPVVLDGIMLPLGGIVFRRPAELVLYELERAEDAAEAASQEASRRLRAQRREERKQTWEERIDTLRDRLTS
ncbi:MAG TPA: hypothetical protein VFC82_05425 [Actinomycetaceae bacterium]|nr:hypothetical protein [Actinomycetaceae bacterium]